MERNIHRRIEFAVLVRVATVETWGSAKKLRSRKCAGHVTGRTNDIKVVDDIVVVMVFITLHNAVLIIRVEIFGVRVRFRTSAAGRR